MSYEIEHTDTFGGQANYCWVNRKTIPDMTDRGIIRKAKAFAGFTGMRCDVESWGDGFRITPRGKNAPCETVFVQYVEETLDA